MSAFLETLKERFATAQKRVQEAVMRLQAAQTEQQAAAQEAASLNYLLQLETQREAAAAQGTDNPIPVAGEPKAVPPVQQSELNKTDLIREQLRQHPNGLRPAEVWNAIKDQIPQRSYVYAVLGRLKSREQATWKRGKYYFRVSAKPEEEKTEQRVLIQ
jgi:hypothetical protein